MSTVYDAVIVGGGHNGLVCSAYLAKHGWRVLVLEAAEQVGGGAVTREFATGYKLSTCAHLLHLLQPQIRNELELEQHGLSFSNLAIDTVALDAEGAHAAFAGDVVRGATFPHGPSHADIAKLATLKGQLRRFAAALRPLLSQPPPRLGTIDWADRRTLLKTGWAIRQLGRDDMREFLRIVGLNIADLLEDSLQTPLLQGAVAFDAVLGAWLGPRSPGSVFTLIYRMMGEASGGNLTHPRGGMGALSEALGRAATARGVEIRTAARVARVLVEDDRACGVELESGEQLAAKVVASNADPRQTFLKLVGERHLDTDFVRKIRHYRTRGMVAKLNLALDRLPEAPGLAPEALSSRLLIAPSVNYLERAFDHCKYGEYSKDLPMEITIPSMHDDSLAPPGKHVLSAIVQYVPYDLRTGWDETREAFGAAVLDTLERYLPGLRKHIVAEELLTPLDIERGLLLSGGHWHHGELALDQFLMLRPVPGAAQYATPLPGLYLCGAGAHPGGGVMGAPGRNAAQRIVLSEVKP